MKSKILLLLLFLSCLAYSQTPKPLYENYIYKGDVEFENPVIVPNATADNHIPNMGQVRDSITVLSSSLPSGGTTGQVLAKASNTDNDVEWVDQSGFGTPLETASTVIDLSNTTGNYNYINSPTTADNFSLTGVTIGGKAYVLIDTTGDSQFPQVTGSEEKNSAPFQEGTIFLMVVENFGTAGTFHNFIKWDSGSEAVLTSYLDTNGYSIIGQSQTALGDGSTTIDWTLGNNFDFEFGAQNEVFTFTDPPKPGNFLLKLKQDGVGLREATWPVNVVWPGLGSPQSLSDDGTNIVEFYFDGSHYYVKNFEFYETPVSTASLFISQWQTTTASESITIPIGSNPARSVDFTVDWGDGSADDTYTGTTDGITVTHTYADAGTYNITVTPNVTNGWKGVYFNNTGDKAKIVDIIQWGDSELELLNFYGCVNLTGGSATDAPNVSAMTSLSNAFRDTAALTITNWSLWQPYLVTNYQATFRDSNANGGHPSWITANAVDLDQMHLNSNFNQDWSTADFTNVNQMSLFVNLNSVLSAVNADAILNRIYAQAPGIQSSVTLDLGDNGRTSASDTAYMELITIYSWIINIIGL